MTRKLSDTSDHVSTKVFATTRNLSVLKDVNLKIGEIIVSQKFHVILVF